VEELVMRKEWKTMSTKPAGEAYKAAVEPDRETYKAAVEWGGR